MDCRMSLAALALLVVTGLAGCTGLQQRLTQSTKTPPAPTIDPIMEAKLQKPKPGPKRMPLPGTIVSLAVIKEREGDKAIDPAVQMKLRDQARVYYQEALKIDPNHRDAIAGLARTYSKVENYQLAFETYQTALTKNPKDAGLWFDLGMCHNRKKEFTEAAGCFRKALAIEPENRQYLQTLGFTLARAGQTQEALAVLTNAGGAALANFNVGRMLLHLGNKDAARQHLTTALQLNPELLQARDVLASLDAPAGAAGAIRPSLALEFPPE